MLRVVFDGDAINDNEEGLIDETVLGRCERMRRRFSQRAGEIYAPNYANPLGLDARYNCIQ
jgi:hypothetical protein